MSISENQLPDLLSVSGLHGGYGKIPILTGINLEVRSGEFVGILGHNGMGKTTFLRTLMGHLKATSGKVELEGVDITKIAPEKRARAGIGYVPQGRQIFSTLSVLENLELATLNNPNRQDNIIESLLEDFPRLKPLLDRRGGVLSGGEQQLLALARCLATSPKLILLDEPTEGIQPSIIDEIQEQLDRFKAADDVAFILVEQNLEFIRTLSDRVLIMQKGQITKELSPEEILQPDLIHEFAGLAAS